MKVCGICKKFNFSVIYEKSKNYYSDLDGEENKPGYCSYLKEIVI